MGSECLSFGQLAERGVLKFGDGYRTKSTELGETGFPILRVGIVADGRVKASVSNDLIRSEYRSSIGQKFSRLGDIVLTTKGTVGRTARIDIDTIGWVYSPQVCYFRVVDETVVHPGYLYAYMRSDRFKKQAEVLASQTDMAPYLSLKDLAGIEIDLPPLPEQRRIAKILGDLDDKIELNRTMNETLEAMARALFKSWFVDFDPVRAKMEGRQPEGMDAETAALFPDKLVESELGMIPEGWEVGKVNDEFNVLMGQSPPGTTYNQDKIGLPFYQGSVDFSFRYPKRRVYTTDPKRIANYGDTLVSVRAPVGDINMADEKCCIGRGLAAIRHKSGATSYTYHAMANLHPVFSDYEAGGTIFGSISKASFNLIQLICPQPRIISLYESMIGSIDNKVRRREQESLTLGELREVLLPKLISGEVSVRDADGYSERVGA